MNLHALDWSIIAVFLAALTVLTLHCRRYVVSVGDFLAAGRVGGRYLLTVSQGLGGAISMVASWEMIYAAGLPTQWWGMMTLPVTLLFALSGFIVYRYRQTRVLTLSQFFEARYSRRFRLFAGALAWVSGILNYGIFPAVTARFLIYFMGLPLAFTWHGLTLSTFPLVMLAYLGFALFTALGGGQISIMLTDFFQGTLTLILFVVISIYLFHRFAWGDIVAGLQVSPAGQSKLNPFASGQASDFNLSYFLIAVFSQIYNAGSWQGTTGFNAAARTPHEAKMAGLWGSWRLFVQSICLLLIPISAYAVMHLPKFEFLARPIQAQLAAIHDPTVREQMTVPLFLGHILPTGLTGLFAAIIVSAAISCDNSYLHSWGSILIQDVVSPLRRRPLSPANHLLVLRLSIVGVAVFGFCFSLLFPLRDYILMYFVLTGAIYMGGSGAVIIGGLYWKRGTTPAAWTALITGSILAFGGLAIRQFWSGEIDPFLQHLVPGSPWLVAHAQDFPLNGQVIYLIAMLTASTSYVLISLLGPRQSHDMDKLLHRGAFALPEDRLAGSVERLSWRERLGLTREFTKSDRRVFWATASWSIAWTVIFLAGLVWNAIWGTTSAGWSWFWWTKICLSFGLGVMFSGWLIYGGVRDALQLFRDLGHPHGDPADDGRVVVSGKTGFMISVSSATQTPKKPQALKG